MDAITWEQALAELKALALPTVVRTAFVDPQRVPPVLGWLMRDPTEMFDEPHDPSAHAAVQRPLDVRAQRGVPVSPSSEPDVSELGVRAW
jgi:hypothetical protein